MTEDTRSRLADLKMISIVVGLTIGMGTLGWSVASWATGRQSKEASISEHIEIRAEMQKADLEIGGKVDEVDAKAQEAIVEVQSVGRDVKTVKCILLAPSRKAKGRCGLE